MIAIVYYGVGNIRSIHKAVEYVGGKAVVTSDPEEIESADGIILPGVGAFRAAIKELEPLRDVIVKAKVPVMGICLGMQLFASESEEDGIHRGLNIIPGRVIRFPRKVGKIPHMGWNQINVKKSNYLLEGLDGKYVYFVHSYYFATDEEYVLTTTEYGIEFASSVVRDNFVGFQFHPEKSGKVGLEIIRRFVEHLD